MRERDDRMIPDHPVYRTLRELGWELVLGFAIEVGRTTLRADAVLLFQGGVLAVLEVRTRRQGDNVESRQPVRLAEVLGAPLALLVLGDVVYQLRDVPGVVPGRLHTLPTPEATLELLGPLKRLFVRPVPPCVTVATAVANWKANGATRTGVTYLPAVEFYADEYEMVCPRVPLTQCTLIGGIFEGILRETAVAKRAPKARSLKLQGLIDWCTANGFLTVGIGACTPHDIRKSRNALHPNLFVRTPVGHAVATNVARALATAVDDLNATV
ncbi:hypothetical protein [Deinococcus peraridilitoris]|nr:hypothetical protein [Deinococcus peraridilitoris]